ncbi:MAG: phage holin family protein [Chlorobiaceae bacterium]|nr:phage holin family protein [Chlorobiaceae bacterium]
MTNMEQENASAKGSKRGIPGLIDKTVSSTYEDLMAIIEARMELIKIDLTEKVALVGALLILLVIFMIGTAYFITSTALLVGELVGHPFIGYLVVSLSFLAAFTVLTKFRPDLLKNFIHKILLSANDYRS